MGRYARHKIAISFNPVSLSRIFCGYFLFKKKKNIKKKRRETKSFPSSCFFNFIKRRKKNKAGQAGQAGQAGRQENNIKIKNININRNINRNKINNYNRNSN